MKKALFTIISLFIFINLYSQVFEEQTSISLTGVAYSSVDWGDYNGDGYLDILLTGSTGENSRVTRVYRNNGFGGFTAVSTSIPGVQQGCAKWIDVDNDGYLDIIITGNTGNEAIGKLYKNNNGNSFTENTSFYIGEIFNSSITCADFNNDGYMDFIVSGYSGWSSSTIMYLNNKNGGFYSINASFNGMEISYVEWGDVNNDNLLDFVITGKSSSNSSTYVYINRGNNTFTSNYITGGMSDYSKASFGDVDDDGYLDLIVISNSQSRLYKNDGNGNFSVATGSYSGLMCSGIAWGDFDNDGDLDLVYCGTSNGSYTGRSTKFYNNNNGTLSSTTIGDIPNVYHGDLAWGDYDNDGKLDLLITGYTGYEYIAKIYKNVTPGSNTPPQIPTNLSYSQNGDTITLTWSESSDNSTPVDGITYDLYIKDAQTNKTIFYAPSNINTGKRRFSHRGRINTNSIEITGLPDCGTYYWRVQAVDNSFYGSQFSSESTFVYAGNKVIPEGPITGYIGEVELSCIETSLAESREWKYSQSLEGSYISFDPPQTDVTCVPSGSLGTIYVMCESIIDGIIYASNKVRVTLKQFELVSDIIPGVSSGDIVWGDYNNDGLFDFIITGGSSSSTKVSKIYKNLGNYSFEEQTNIIIESLSDSKAVWGDYNNDGFIDLIICGTAISGSITKIYKNTGNGNFVEQTDINLPGLSNGYIVWGDYDNDGLLDILLSGSASAPYNTTITKIFKNEGNNRFTPQEDISLQGINKGCAVWADLNNDGLLDIIISGQDSNTARKHAFYKNNGNNNFTEISYPFQSLLNSKIEFGDYDNDGDLDILMIGTTQYSSGNITKVYENIGNFQFVENSSSFDGIYLGDSQWVDYDNDGHLDVYLCGTSSGISRLYKNDKNGNFILQSISDISGLRNSSAAWTDINNSGNMDLIITGYTGSDYKTYIYKSHTLAPNTVPEIPTNMGATFVGEKEIKFSWNKATDFETPQDGLKYNLSIKNLTFDKELYPVMANIEDGKRRIAGQGMIPDTLIILKELLPGQLQLKVQAVDNSFAGSEFSEEIIFENNGSLIHPKTEQHININQPVETLTFYGYPLTTEKEWKYSKTPGGPYISFEPVLTEDQISPYFLFDGIYYIICQFTDNNITYISNEVKVNVNAFEIISGINLANLRISDMFLGDLDNDNDLDLFITGSTYTSGTNSITKIYDNNLGNFNEILDLSSSEHNKSNAAWGDYNNDGYLDFIIGNKIYKNNGDYNFIHQSDIEIDNLLYTTSAWGDYDNDGLLDLLITGQKESNVFTHIYRNEGDNTFSLQSDITLKGALEGTVLWGDYNNDGYLDILLFGKLTPSSSYKNITIYKNNGDNSFGELLNSGIDIPFYSSNDSYANWFDYNDDGYLDVMLSGNTSNYGITKLYKNLGDETFVEIDQEFTIINSKNKITYGDYDNDGDIDILISGIYSSKYTNIMYRNEGNDNFSKAEIVDFETINITTAVFADYDNDGDLDIIINGETVSHILKNLTLYTNTPPEKPDNLNTTFVDDEVLFSWDIPEDNSTPSSGITYDIFIINTRNNDSVIFNVMADTVTGYRLFPAKGKIQKNSFTPRLIAGEYKWSIQAIDNTFAGSEFSDWAQLQVKGCDILPAKEQYAYVNTLSVDLRINEFPAADSRQWKYSEQKGGPYIPFDPDVNSEIFQPVFETDGTFYIICESLIDDIVYTSNEVIFHVNAFRENPGMSIANTVGSWVWGDYNNDGYLDAILHKTLYRNEEGNNLEVQNNLSLAGYGFKWGDYDNDGDLDLLSLGSDNKIYKNLGNGLFEEINLDFDYMLSGTLSLEYEIEWADFDNDGDLDILYNNRYSSKLRLYENMGNDFFVLCDVFNTYSFNGSAKFGDFNNDGYLDIIASGQFYDGVNNSYSTKIYKNNGDNTFEELVNNHIEPLINSYIDCGDYNSDGKLDILICGTIVGSEGEYITKIYRNDGDFIFTGIENTDIIGITNGMCKWGDYNNDGKLDFVISGNKETHIYRNEGNDVFIKREEIKLPLLSNVSIEWIDYDNDGDLDLSVSGNRYISPTLTEVYAAIYENSFSENNANTKPEPPANLISEVIGDNVILSWDNANDLETPAKGLTYNLKIVDIKTESYAFPSMADTVTGLRLISGRGMIQDTVIKIHIPAGDYIWSVQAIDNNFEGSGFAQNEYFSITGNRISPDARQYVNENSPGEEVTVSEFPAATSREWKYSRTSGGPYRSFENPQINETIIPVFLESGVLYLICESNINGITYISNEAEFYVNPFIESPLEVSFNIYNSNIKWADYDNDGYLDFTLIGSSYIKIFKNNGDGTFTESIDLLSSALYELSVDWGDYNNDGYLDLAMIGRYSPDSYTKIFKNNGDGTFTEQTDIELEGNYNGSVAWGDYNNDGFLDLLISGRNGTRLYKNEGNNVFIEQTHVELAGTYNKKLEWGDYDNDGYLDILLSSKIYRNTGDGNFEELTHINFGITDALAASWGDYDNDGDLDLVIVGPSTPGASDHKTKIYKNEGNNIFTELTSNNIIGLLECDIKWGDYDNDGYLDIIIIGKPSYSSAKYYTNIYRYEGNDIFKEQLNMSVENFATGSVSWADHDNDGDLDLIICGEALSTRRNEIRIYENITYKTNNIPDTPDGLTENIENNSVTFVWNPAVDHETPEKGLTYNLKIYDIQNEESVYFISSDTLSGNRLLAQRGNIQDTSYTITLPVGSYKWSVQAIDRSFKGSAFAPYKDFAVNGVSIYPSADQYTYINEEGNTLYARESQEETNSRVWKFSTQSGGPYNEFSYENTDVELVPVFDSDGKYFIICETTINEQIYISNEVVIYVSAFKEVEDLAITGFTDGGGEWGDINNDGLLDLIIAGKNSNYYNDVSSKIYINNGEHNFSELNIDLPGLRYNNSQWIDFNNDGNIDLSFFGNNSGYYFKLYENLADNNFIEHTDIGLEMTSNISVSWVDIDNDGDLDMIISVPDDRSNYSTKIYENNNNEFIYKKNIEALDYYLLHNIKWVDYDNDGKMDAFITARYFRNGNGNGTIANMMLLKNEGNLEFSAITFGEEYSIAPQYDLGDYNNDGYIDLIIYGGRYLSQTTDSYDTKIYVYNNNNFIEQTQLNLPNINANVIKWIDYDNDGNLDFIISGYSDQLNYVTKIYQNTGEGDFIEHPHIFNIKPNCKDFVIGDIDNDGDLDILALITSPINNDPQTILYENLSIQSNTNPSVPVGLEQSIDIVNNEITFKWNHASDNETPEDALTYNIRIFDNINQKYVTPVLSDIETGKLLTTETGIINDTSIVMKLKAGQYKWSIQSVDNGYLSSEFSEEIIFDNAGCSITPEIAQSCYLGQFCSELTVYEYPVSADYREWKYSITPGGPYVSFNQIITGSNFTPVFNEDGYKYIICESNINGTVYRSNEVRFRVERFEVVDIAEIQNVNRGSLSWGDTDNDGDYDLFLTGNSYPNIAKMYINDENNSFVSLNNIVSSGLWLSSSEFGDYDNDGKLDLIVSGQDGSSRITQVYKNIGDNIFEHQNNISLTGVRSGTTSWVDYDNDGDLDIFITGSINAWPISEESGHQLKVYKNEMGEFIEQIDIDLPKIFYSSIDWGDLDNDGDLDLILAGKDESNTAKTFIFENIGNGNFSQRSDIIIPGVLSGDVKWGDYNNDGYLDFAITGSGITKIYKNNSGNAFTELPLMGLLGLSSSRLAWGDYDNDGDLDLIVTGTTTGGATDVFLKIYENKGNDIFVENGNVVIDGIFNGAIQFVDYDSDGDLDIVLTGLRSSSHFNDLVSYTAVYKNHSPQINTEPTVPENLAVNISDKVYFSWDISNDNETEASGLNYNIVVKNTETNEFITPVMSDIETGKRLVPKRGMIQNTSYNLTLPDGSYSWAVQSIDAGFLSSGFSYWQNFTVPSNGNEFEVTFKVYYNFTPVEDAVVHFNAMTQVTNSLGEAIFSIVPEGNNYEYNVIKPTFFFSNDIVDIHNDETIIINLRNEVIFDEIVVSDPLCYGYSDGSIKILAFSGNGTLEYSIDNGNSWYQADLFENLSSGEYFIKVKDESSMIFEYENNPVLITDPDGIIIHNLVSTDITCNGENNGTIQINASGGVSPLQYSIINGVWQDENAFTSLSQGEYIVSVKGNDGCEVYYSENPIIITQPELLSISNVEINNITCNDHNNGRIEITASGGTESIEYSIIENEWQNENIFENLEDGNYNIKIKDSNGCIVSYSNNPVEIFNPDTISILNVLSENVTGCFDNNNGSIQIFAEGGTGMLEYNIIDGEWQSESNFTGLYAREYIIKVRDANNCIIQNETPVVISEPLSIVIESVSAQNITCYGLVDGRIDIHASGGTGELQYSIIDGMWSSNSVFSDMEAGEYNIRIKDENNCEIQYSENPVTIIEPQEITMTLVTSDNLCFGDDSGNITVSAAGGTGSIYYSLNESNWQSSPEFSNLHSGDYTVMIKDENDCMLSETTILTEPQPITIINLSVTDVTGCYGDNNGEISFTASGGAGNLLSSISNGIWENSVLFNGLSAGEYNLRIKDENNCSFEYENNPIQILQPDLIEISEVLTTPDNGTDNGTIVIHADGGYGSLQYSIDNGVSFQLSNEFSGLQKGNYDIVVKDEYDCRKTYNTTIEGLYKVNFYVKEAYSNNPVEDVLVEFNNEEKNTDITGSVSFENIPNGEYGYLVQKEGYGSIIVTPDDNERITVNEEDVIKEILLSNVSVNIVGNNNIKIYPNPTSGILYIEGDFSGKVIINVNDAVGKHILLKEFTSTRTSIDLTNYQPGIYFIEIICEKYGKSLIKIIKE
jgi:hypothetical protein